MSLSADDTSRDLPVKDLGLSGGTMPVMQEQNVRLWRGPAQMVKIQDHQRVFKVPRDQLEDQFLRLLEENKLLKQNTRIQEQKLRRLSTKLMRLKNAGPGSAGGRDAETEDTIEALEARVATLESQKEIMHNKLKLAKKQIQALDGKSYQRQHTGRAVQEENDIRRASQTLPRYAFSLIEDNGGDTENSRSGAIEAQRTRSKEFKLASQSLREVSNKEVEDTIRRLLRQQVDMHRLTIKDNVDVIRLQKQLCDNRTALLVSQEKFTMLQEAYETQLSEGQKSLQDGQTALLERVEKLTEQIKEEKKKVMSLEGQLNTANLTLQGLAELQERILDLENERNLLKRSYEALLESTLSVPNQNHLNNEEKERGSQVDREHQANIDVLEEKIENEKKQREKLEQENMRFRNEYQMSQGERAKELALTVAIKERNDRLEREVFQRTQEVTSLREKLDKVPKDFEMSAEELSETLLQIKTFRLHQESRKELQRLRGGEKIEDIFGELSSLQASHAETVLELQKTRCLLVMQHRISSDLQAELKMETEKAKREQELNIRVLNRKEKLLNSRALQIKNLQAQLKDLSYNPRKQFIPEQCTTNGINHELFYQMDENMPTPIQDGESVLEIHLSGVTFTPFGLRLMRQGRDARTGGSGEPVTFCTFSFFDFEVHSTPLVSGTQPNYGFKSCFALSCFNLTRLGGPGASAHVELHQALGGVTFVTRGRGTIPLVGTLEHRGEKVKGRASITGSTGEIIGILEFWVCLYPQEQLKSFHVEQIPDKTISRWPTHQADWSYKQPNHQDLYDYGGGTPNELVVVLERCSGVTARWPGLLPDAYLTYRLYDLPPHSTPIVPCCADPVFSDSTIYPLAVTADLLEYLKVSSLWVYMFDEGEKQIPPLYLAKTSVPLQALTTGRPIKGDFVLRDTAGVPRGMVRMNIHWRYPFQLPVAPFRPKRKEEAERDEERIGECEIRTVKETLQRPVAKPRKQLPSSPRRTLRADVSQHFRSPASKSLVQVRSLRANKISKSLESESTASSDSDAVIIPHSVKPSNKLTNVQTMDGGSLESSNKFLDSITRFKGWGSFCVEFACSPLQVDRIRVEILSLLFHPTSSVALAQSVQQVYVEYRLLGIPMKTTETPMSLRKPTEGEEIHYNFSRVIHINTMEAAPLRQYLYTVLEGTDPNQGRLKFTVVSEPLNEEHECEDIGQAYLDLRQLLLTGNDVTERQINITRMDDDQDVVGKLKVSLEAAQALIGIYLEYHNQAEE